MVCGNALEPANSDRLPIDALSAAGWLARTIAGATQDARKYIGFSVDHVGVRESPLRYQPDVLRHIRMRRACPLAIDYFVVVIWISNVGRLHKIESCEGLIKRRIARAIPGCHSFACVGNHGSTPLGEDA
jgi:hypothetical protein